MSVACKRNHLTGPQLTFVSHSHYYSHCRSEYVEVAFLPKTSGMPASGRTFGSLLTTRVLFPGPAHCGPPRAWRLACTFQCPHGRPTDRLYSRHKCGRTSKSTQAAEAGGGHRLWQRQNLRSRSTPYRNRKLCGEALESGFKKLRAPVCDAPSTNTYARPAVAGRTRSLCDLFSVLSAFLSESVLRISLNSLSQR